MLECEHHLAAPGAQRPELVGWTMLSAWEFSMTISTLFASATCHDGARPAHSVSVSR